LAQLEPTLTAERSQHRNVASHTFKPDGAIHPRPLYRRLAFELQAKFLKEHDRGLEVIDNDADIIHPKYCHIFLRSSLGPPTCITPYTETFSGRFRFILSPLLV